MLNFLKFLIHLSCHSGTVWWIFEGWTLSSVCGIYVAEIGAGWNLSSVCGVSVAEIGKGMVLTVT